LVFLSAKDKYFFLYLKFEDFQCDPCYNLENEHYNTWQLPETASYQIVILEELRISLVREKYFYISDKHTDNDILFSGKVSAIIGYNSKRDLYKINQ